jgi:phosphotransferase system enzyme I (PtsI)
VLGVGFLVLCLAALSVRGVLLGLRLVVYLASARFARQVMDQWDSGRIAMLLDDFNALAT